MEVLEVDRWVVQSVDPMEVPMEVPLEVPLEAQMGHRLGSLEAVQREGLSVLMVTLKARVDRMVLVDQMVPVMEGRFRFLP